MTALETSLVSLDSRFKEIGEDTAGTHLGDHKADPALTALGFVDDGGALTPAGDEYFMARVVRDDDEAASETLAALLRSNAVVTGFCSSLWGVGDTPVTGAVSLLIRLTGDTGNDSAKRWLELMNRAKLIAYNRKSPTLRVLFNPEELVPPDEAASREKDAGHVISPDSPFSNLLALRDLLRATKGYIYWYEQHMEKKVMEVLHRELRKGDVDRIRLLSGPANMDDDTKEEFKRFKKEMKATRDIECEWRVLTKNEAQLHHDRFLFSEGIARNLPPLNLILRGSKGEVLPSKVEVAEFEEWWDKAEDIFALSNTLG